MAAGKRTLSSRFTVFYKFFPFVGCFVFGIAAAVVWVDAFKGNGDASGPPELKWVVLGVWAVPSTCLLWFGAGLKKVRRDGEFLYVSNYRREIKVPFSEVVSVTEIIWISPPRVTVHFRAPTEFGQTITFMPRMLVLWMSHPVVQELRLAAGLPVRAG